MNVGCQRNACKTLQEMYVDCRKKSPGMNVGCHKKCVQDVTRNEYVSCRNEVKCVQDVTNNECKLSPALSISRHQQSKTKVYLRAL